MMQTYPLVATLFQDQIPQMQDTALSATRIEINQVSESPILLESLNLEF